MTQTVNRSVLLAAHEQIWQTYLETVDEVETELGYELPRFRGIRFHFIDYAPSGDMAANPYFRSYPLEQKPVWSLDSYEDTCRAALGRLDAEGAALREEFGAHLRQSESRFRPTDTGYFGSDSTWQALDIVEESGQPILDTLRMFPRMAERIEQLVELRLLCRTYFSHMRPGAHLPLHCGGNNTYLRMHVPLLIPPGDCGIRLGGEVYRWRHGHSLIFDDTFPHEAWNRTERDRYILLLRVLHPSLSMREREAHFRIESRFKATPIYERVIELRSKLSLSGYT